MYLYQPSTITNIYQLFMAVTINCRKFIFRAHWILPLVGFVQGNERVLMEWKDSAIRAVFRLPQELKDDGLGCQERSLLYLARSRKVKGTTKYLRQAQQGQGSAQARAAMLKVGGNDHFRFVLNSLFSSFPQNADFRRRLKDNPLLRPFHPFELRCESMENIN